MRGVPPIFEFNMPFLFVVVIVVGRVGLQLLGHMAPWSFRLDFLGRPKDSRFVEKLDAPELD